MNIHDTAQDLELPTTRVAEQAWAAARTRVRRRRRVRGAVAGSALAVALVATGIAALDTSTEPGAVATGTGTPPPTAQAADCASTEVGDLAYPPDGRVPAGAVAARLCPVNGSVWQAPPELLTTGLEDLVDLMNEHPEGKRKVPRELCMGHGPSRDYAIVLDYPDGSESAAWGRECGDAIITGKGHEHPGAGELIAEFLEQVVAQRQELAAPVAASVAPCPEDEGIGPVTVVPSGRDLDLASAVVCTYEWSDADAEGAYRLALTDSRTLDPATVGRLDKGFRANATAVDQSRVYADLGSRFLEVVATTTWGDVLHLPVNHGQLVRGSSLLVRDSTTYGWTMDPETLALLE